ncbi:DNA-binding transcriptional regulator of sugar metabolism, DeoR/GlpR family [Salibacterium halotolerans]|uniref:DNA-binding transcriptional regulator of sugar metabolism, DeoR/GlpR family n=1 Tax=Salibacterium halotolerans TaxID=1884432 RepID=A0A1I5XTY1_9BACI|nr:DNA-binding transcriptional regulator of sugar metabolism, DeoR/GlpR family [Salibacterium halotolerans]
MKTSPYRRKVGKRVLVAERYERILQTVDEKGSVRVSELSEQFGVTEETIRRDLDHLEKENKIKRSHGGAVSNKNDKTETPYSEREITNVDEKNGIARKALEFIAENDRIILDASSTAWYMARGLPDIPLIVLTNSMKVSAELSEKQHIQVISTGGMLTPRSLSFVGPLTEYSINMYHVDKVFLSCQGIHAEKGLSDSSELQAHVKQKMIEAGDDVYVLADHTKFNVQSFSRIAGWGAVDTFVTDKIKDDDRMHLQEKNLDVYTL